MVTMKWLFSGTLDWIRLTCEWTIRLQSSSPLPYEFVIQGYNIVFFTLALDERRWKRVAGSSIFVSSSWSFFPVSLYQLFTVDQHTCWVLRGGALLRPDCRCDQSCLSAPPLALVGVTMLHLVRETLRGEESAVEVMCSCYYHVWHFHCLYHFFLIFVTSKAPWNL